MTRREAFELCSAIADAGMHASMSITSTRGGRDTEYCNVSVNEMSLTAERLRSLIVIGDAHGVDLHLVSNQLMFFDRRPDPQAQGRL